MKISSLIFDETDLLEVTEAVVLDGHKICISFNDGKTVVNDFKPFLSASHHPEIRKYLDLDMFKSFKILHGNLNWNDFDMIFPVGDLYKGMLSV